MPEVPEFIRAHAGLSDEEAYGTFNMGAGMGLYLPEAAVQDAIGVAGRLGFWLAHVGHVGHVGSGARAVHVVPLGLRFDGSSLQLRLERSAP